MDEKLERGISTLEYILNNMFVCLVVYYSTLIWSYFNKENLAEYKFIQDAQKILVKYNDLILFVSVISVFIAYFIRRIVLENGVGIKEDDNSRAVDMLRNANKLDRIGSILFLIIIPLSLYHNFNNSLIYSISLLIAIIIVLILSKTVLLIKKRISEGY